MTECATVSAECGPETTEERRGALRTPTTGTLWMIDHAGHTVLRCQCVEVSESGMRLRVPLGYGVAEGQRYELRSHLPGAAPGRDFGLMGSRWATVVRTQVRLGHDEDHLDVGVYFEGLEPTLLTTGHLLATGRV